MVDQLVMLTRKNLTVLLITIALSRIFVFNAAFPVFNNIDEGAHFDLVVKYSKGHLPTINNRNYDKETAAFIAKNGTFEYLSSDESTLPPVRSTSIQAKVAETVSSSVNHEALSPPLYYIIGGIWYKVGKLLHLSGGWLIYWVRFLNIPLYFLLILVAKELCQEVFPDNEELQHGVLLLLAFFPQSIFYSINNDVLSSIVFPAAVIAVLRLQKNDPSVLKYLIAGALVATLPLTKLSNIPGVVVLALLICKLCYGLYLKPNNVKARLAKMSLLLVSAVIPPVLWFWRNYYLFNDWAGMKGKLAQLGWVAKPLDTVYDHPLFTFSGATLFLSELIKAFWRGELVWHLRPVSLLFTDYFYVLTTLFLLTFGFILHWRSETHTSNDQFMFYMFNFTMFLNVLLLAVLSIRYDFGSCWYPSHEFPYFTSGRLIVGALVPFLILYANGISAIFRRFDESGNTFIVLASVGGICLFSEVLLSLKYTYFGSPFNFFSLLLNT